MIKQKEANPQNAAVKGNDQERQVMPGAYAGRPDLKRPTVLLHSCCGPCSTAVVEELASEYAITVFFYNPNITDADEYEKRKQNQIKFIEAYNENPDRPDVVAFLLGDYETERFYEETKGLEEVPEGGQRCKKCFKLRLEKTAEMARLMGYDCFASTLAVSPRKDYASIGEIGRDLCARYGVGFLDRDFKKGGGYQKSVEMSKRYGLYRQKYCGCEYARDIGARGDMR